MPRKLRELRSDLRRAGWGVVRQKGSHETWKHPEVKGYSVGIAGKDGDDAHSYQEDHVREALRRTPKRWKK